MKKVILSSLALMGTLLVAAAAAAPPEKLALTDLVNRPERWPVTAAIKGDFKLNNGTVIHPGDKLQVLQFDGTRVVLATAGNIRFAAKPEDCGFLDAANAAWTALTPAQRAIEPDTLAADPSLWPLRVAFATPISCNFGKLPAGTEAGVLTVTNKEIVIAWPNSPNRVTVDFVSTDVIKRARELALVDRDKRPSRIAAALQGVMVDADGKAHHDDKLGDRKIFAFYYGANWCAPCHAFSPAFVKFLNDALPKHPELAVVMMSNDEKPDEMLKYMKEEKMPFPAVPLKDVNASSLLTGYAAKMIPHLIIVDRFGKVLATNEDSHGERTDPEDTIGALAKLLAAPAGGR